MKRKLMRKVVTANAPAAIGPYCQAVISYELVHTSGQIGLSPATGALAGESIEEQTEQVCRNLSAVLRAAGSDLDLVIKTTCFLAHMEDFAKFNEIYAKYFPLRPARSCVGVAALPKGALVEVEVIAELSDAGIKMLDESDFG